MISDYTNVFEKSHGEWSMECKIGIDDITASGRPIIQLKDGIFGRRKFQLAENYFRPLCILSFALNLKRTCCTAYNHTSRLFFLLLCSTLLTACSSSPSSLSLPSVMEEINGRDTLGPRLPIYRAKIPMTWIRRDTFPEDSIVDTTKPLVEFIIIPPRDSTTKLPITISIHNFPYETLEQHIPPQAQVARWQRQFDTLSSHLSSIQPQSFNGFTGLLFIGVGQQSAENITTYAWAMQIPLEHYRMLLPSSLSSNKTSANTDPATLMQMRADVTIKATGPSAAMELHRDEIIAFARSFELIEEIPTKP